MSKNITEEEEDVLCDYTLLVFLTMNKPEEAEKANATPETCPENIKALFIKEFGDDWVEMIWGEQSVAMSA